jgi:hypothetical protein
MKTIKLAEAIVIILPRKYLNRFGITKGMLFNYVINDDKSITIKPKVV